MCGMRSCAAWICCRASDALAQLADGIQVETDMNTGPNWLDELQETLELLRNNHPEDCAARLRTLLRACENHPLRRALTLDSLGRALLALGQHAQAVAALEESLALLRAGAGSDAALLAGVMQNLAHVWLESGNPQKSAALGLEAVQLCEAAFGQDSPRLAAALFHLSAAHYRQKCFDDAENCLQRAQAIWEKQNPLPQELGTCYNNLGRIEEERGHMAQGIALHRKALALRQKLLGGCHEDTAFSLGNLGVALAADGQWAEAADMLEAAVACYARLGRYAGPESAGYKQNLEVCRKALAAGRATSAANAPTGAPGLLSGTAERREGLLLEIIERELVMFLATPNEGGAASCQQSPDGFRLTRRMAHEPLSLATLESYVEDLRRAERLGRNFMIEKYARMDNRIPPLQDNPRIGEIVAAESAFMREAAVRFPAVITSGGEGQFENYLRCELETLSPATLDLYAEDMRRAAGEHRNPVEERYRRLARLMGRDSLEAMEREALRA